MQLPISVSLLKHKNRFTCTTYPNIVAFGGVYHRMRYVVDTMLIEIFIENEEIKIT